MSAPKSKPAESYYQKNKAAILARSREYYAANREKILARVALYQKRNGESYRKYQKQYYRQVRKGSPAEIARYTLHNRQKWASGYYGAYRLKTIAKRRECARRWNYKNKFGASMAPTLELMFQLSRRLNKDEK